MSLIRKLLWSAFFLATLGAIGKTGFELARVLAFEARGAMDSDVLLFFTVARGWLNGFLPYTEIFESKPPGIFLFAALSLILTDGNALLVWLGTALFALLPAVLAAFAFRNAAGQSGVLRWAVAALALLIGLLLTLYVEERSPALLTEFWGGVFGTFYVLTVAWPENEIEPGTVSRGKPYRVRCRRIALASLFLLGSIGMKEPFLPVLLSAALLVCRTPRRFLLLFCVPLLAAGVVGVLAAFVFGILGPYGDVYLPAMFQGRVGGDPFESLWMRGFAAGRLFANLTTYYPNAPLFGYLLGALWLSVPVFKSRGVSAATAVLSAVHLWLLYECMKALSVLLVLWNAMRQGVQVNQQLYDGTFRVGLLALVPFVLLSVLLYRRKAPVHVLTAFAALFLASSMVGIGGYVGNHFVFALPFFAALVILFARHMASPERQAWTFAVVAVIAAYVAFTYEPTAKHLAYLAERTRFTPAAQAQGVARVDGMMDACGFERYYGVNTFERLAFTEHSTVGPLPVITFHEYLPMDHPLVAGTYANIREKADIIIKPPGPMDRPYNMPIDAIIAERFTNEAPACARAFLPVAEGLEVLFRME